MGKRQARSGTKKTQKELQRTQYVFLHASKRGKAYHNYFNPDPQVENRLMGLADKVRARAQVGEKKNIIFSYQGMSRGKDAKSWVFAVCTNHSADLFQS